MRSRYTAYVINDEHYLTKTWHASTRPEKLALQESQPQKWLGLKILKTERGAPSDTEGVVEFVARYKVNGRAGRVHEVSQFIHENGQWLYLDGQLIE
jgi:SEC-C motif-containing protein